MQPVIHEKLPYDPARDLVPISIASDIFIVIATTGSLETRSIADLVAAARKQPGKLNWAAGPGLLPQYVFAAFLKSSGLDMTLVSYREVPPLLQDFREGRLHTVAHSLAAVRSVVQSGNARLLAIRQQPARFGRTGCPDGGRSRLSGTGHGWVLPILSAARGISNELRDKIARDVRTVASDPKVAERLAGSGQVARAGTPG